MQVLITTITSSVKGGEIRQDNITRCQRITLGRGTDQVLHCPDPRIALEHAVITATGQSSWQLSSISSAGVLVNDRRINTCALKIGDVLKLGGSRFKLCKAPADDKPQIDLAIEVRHKDPDKPGSEAPATRIHQPQGYSRRRLSWLLFVLILTLGLGLPLAGFFQPDIKQNLTGIGSLLGDKIWLTGDLSSGHQHFGNDCTTCHASAFTMVTDQTCMECHADTASHAHEPTISHPQVRAEHCGSCHKEHNGDQLIITRQNLCGDCHTDVMSKTGFDTSLLPATDFSTDHPQFQVTMQEPTARGDILSTRVAIDDPELTENSRLSFPHDEHLSAEGLESPDGLRVLECNDCHQVDAGGAYMQPINFDRHCSSCHQLSFDPSDPDRVVPHGKPAEVVDVLTEFYAELALRGASDEVSGIPLNSDNPGDVLLWARRQAVQTGDSLFEGRACGDCHQVSRVQADNRITWTIEPPRINGVWFPKANFDHAKHSSTECTTCHAQAPQSTDSSDVLLPDINVCQDCHGGEHSTNMLASTCITCHQFHNPQQIELPVADTPHQGTLYIWGQPDVERIRQQLQPQTRRRRPAGDGG